MCVCGGGGGGGAYHDNVKCNYLSNSLQYSCEGVCCGECGAGIEHQKPAQ